MNFLKAYFHNNSYNKIQFPHIRFYLNPQNHELAPTPQHFLYFFPLPQGQGSFLPTLGSSRTTGAATAGAEDSIP